MILDIRGPAGADRGSAVLDKATAWKLGFALLKWSGSEAAALAASGIYAPYCSALAALRAIVARVNGVWDDPDLMEFGPLSTESADVEEIAKLVLDRVKG